MTIGYRDTLPPDPQVIMGRRLKVGVIRLNDREIYETKKAYPFLERLKTKNPDDGMHIRSYKLASSR